MFENLTEFRRASSVASGGTSSNVIHATILRILDRLGAKGDVLDFGAGTGGLTTALLGAPAFSRVSGADLFERPPTLSEHVAWVRHDLNESLPLDPASFDVVVAAEVIEHLENPRATAREWFRLLRPGGIVLCSTPNNESFRALVALLLRGHFVSFGESSYPAHITALVRADLFRILVEAGFEAPEIVPSNEGGIPGFPRVSWQRASLGLLRGIRFSDNVFAYARKPSRASPAC